MRSSMLLAVLAILVAGCSDSEDGSDEVGVTTGDVTGAATLLVAGDFSATSSTKTIVNNELAHDSSLELLAVGDMSYTAPYADNDPWASWAGRTYPVMGNHEFNSVAGLGGREPYDMFDGNNAANDHTFPAITTNGLATYDFAYSHELTPGWLLVVVNTGTNCKQQACTSQATRVTNWIKSWRANHGGHGCVIVAMHTARWSTMFSGDADNLPWAPGVAPLWSAAIAQHADLIFQGHVHAYEEFVKLDASGHASATGAKLFTAGSGGRGQVKPLSSNIASSLLVASRESPVNGVVKLALYPGKYGYRFETAASSTQPAATVACNVP
ncbi:MAG: metallophosphoesterase [Kofleriaceae bacterium]